MGVFCAGLVCLCAFGLHVCVVCELLCDVVWFVCDCVCLCFVCICVLLMHGRVMLFGKCLLYVVRSWV